MEAQATQAAPATPAPPAAPALPAAPAAPVAPAPQVTAAAAAGLPGGTNAEELEGRARAAFGRYDRYGVGTISIGELRALLAELELSISPAQFEQYNAMLLSKLERDASVRWVMSADEC